MKYLFAVAAVLFASASMVSAAEPVGKSTLSSMGLGGMEQLSDSTGNTIRGKGTFAGVWGQSAAHYRGQSSANNYEAGANWHGKSSFAQGGSLSYAGKLQVNVAADPTGAAISASMFGGFAGGGARAFAK